MDKEKAVYVQRWFVDLLMAPYPHIIPIQQMYGYGDKDTFDDALFELELVGLVKVDYFSGVQLTPKAVTTLMANILHQHFGNFRQVCNHILDGLGRECVDSSVSSLFDKLLNPRGVIRFSEFPSHSDDNTF